MAATSDPKAAVPSHPIPSTIPAAQDTPVKTTAATMLRFSTLSHYRVSTLNMLGDEMKGYLVGPMPARKFLDEFLPKGELPGYSEIDFPVAGAFQRTLAAQSEMDAYSPFIHEMGPFAPNLRLVDSHANPDTKNCGSFSYQVKPDVCVYSDPVVVGCDSSMVEVTVEFKWDPLLDIFDETSVEDGPDSRPTFLRSTNSARDTLGQITSYICAQLGSQYRTHAFSILVVRDIARIIRWDREGAIVTTPIKYGNDSTLAEFFSRYSQASPGLRGVDTTVSEASADEARLAREQLGVGNTARMLKTTLERNGNTPLCLIFPPPVAQAYVPVGRATRTCVAYELCSCKKVFLKSSWRIDKDDILSEGETYKKLNSANVRNVPNCLAFSDVPGLPQQKTQTLRLSRCKWACPTRSELVRHTYHRLALDTVGLALTAFESAYGLVTSLRDALIAHSDAVNLAKILHRDLSPGNIVTFNGNGLLVDWDLSKMLDSGGPRQMARTGTWQFMSLALLEDQKQHHTPADDLESAFYVLLWTALMNIPSSFEDAAARSLFITDTFDSRSTMGKYHLLSYRGIFRQPLFPNYDPLNRLLRRLRTIFRSRYREEFEDNFAEDMEKSNSDADTQQAASGQASRLDESQATLLVYSDHLEILKAFDECLATHWPHDAPSDPQPIENKHPGRPVSLHIFSKSTYALEVVGTKRAKRRRVELPSSDD